jgi:ADP-ribose pyrophosphatase
MYDGKIVNLRVDQVGWEDGKTATREVIEHRGAAAIVPIIHDNDVVLVRQYRYAVTTELLEVPAGTMEQGETPEECATRELEEETGYKCQDLRKIMEFFTVPGYSTEKIYVYLAKGLTKSQMQTEEDERIKVDIMPVNMALKRIRSGEIQDAKSICALFRVAELL